MQPDYANQPTERASRAKHFALVCVCVYLHKRINRIEDRIKDGFWLARKHITVTVESAPSLIIQIGVSTSTRSARGFVMCFWWQRNFIFFKRCYDYLRDLAHNQIYFYEFQIENSIYVNWVRYWMLYNSRGLRFMVIVWLKMLDKLQHSINGLILYLFCT